MTTKNTLKKWLPPVMFDFLAKLTGKRTRMRGDFKNWDAAMKLSSGYASDDILTRVKAATRAVINDPSKFERDGAVLAQREYPFAVIAVLLDVANRSGGNLTVLDFGGSLGSTYYQCKDFLSNVKNLRWCIVEQEHFVNCGVVEFQNETLKFYHSIDECYAEERPNVILFSGVLQYLPDPDPVLNEAVARRPEVILIDRTPFIEDRTRIAVQVVPGQLGKASYPLRLFAQSDLTRYFIPHYKVLSSFGAVDSSIYYRGGVISFEGIIFQKSA